MLGTWPRWCALVAGLIVLPFRFAGASEGVTEAVATAMPGGTDAVQITDTEAEQPDPSDLFIEEALKPWTGDLDGIVQRGVIRVAVPHNPLFFDYVDGKPVGLAVEQARLLEDHLQRTQRRRVSVILVPVPRDAMIEWLVSGRVDVIDANLTVTPERATRIDFTHPLRDGVSELVTTSMDAPPITSLDDLVPIGLHLRRSSSYFTHVERINAERVAAGLEPIPVHVADERLEDHDLLEMLQGGLIPATVVDDHKGALWAQILDKVRMNTDVAVAREQRIAFAIRQSTPALMETLDRFVGTVRIGSATGNVLDRRYFHQTRWLTNPHREPHASRARTASELIRKFAESYEFEWSLILAQGFQESGLDQTRRSAAGAVGIMQVLPSTARDPAVGIADIHLPEQNVHAGVKYLRLLHDRYFLDVEDPLNRMLFAFAAYNAGPGNINRARRRAERMGLDPGIWFGHVEAATARAVSREPVVYVRNIFAYSVSLAALAQLTAHTPPDTTPAVEPSGEAAAPVKAAP